MATFKNFENFHDSSLASTLLTKDVKSNADDSVRNDQSNCSSADSHYSYLNYCNEPQCVIFFEQHNLLRSSACVHKPQIDQHTIQQEEDHKKGYQTQQELATETYSTPDNCDYHDILRDDHSFQDNLTPAELAGLHEHIVEHLNDYDDYSEFPEYDRHSKPVYYLDSDVTPPEVKQGFISMLGGGRGRRKHGGRRKRGGGRRKGRGRGIPSVPNRRNGIRLQFETNDLLNNATVLNPYNFSYFNLSNPQLSFNGSATAVPYFTSNALQFRKYRVRGFRVVARFENAETYGVIPFVCPLNYLPTNTAATNASYIKNILARKQMCGGINGMNVKTVAVGGSVRSLSGFASTHVEDAYVGLTDGSSAPSDNIYCVVGTDNNGAAAVGGVLCSVTVTFWIDFIERQTPAN